VKSLILLVLLVVEITFSFAQQVKEKRIVVVIGVDGLSGWSIKKYHTPILDSLMAVGSYTLKAKAVNPTLSAPNWASMIMGVEPTDHGILSNHWKPSDRQGKNTPTIFQLMHTQDSSLSLAVFHHWKEFIDLTEKEQIDKMVHIKNESMCMSEASNYLINNQPDFTFIHLDHVDSSGHHFGHKSKEYKRAVLKTDSLVGVFIKSINNSPLKNNVTILFTSDHGFWGKHHGGFFPKEKNIPWIIVGPQIKRGEKIKTRINTFDTAATLCYLFKTPIPSFWKGKVVKEAFITKP
jgi:predicted AlkP superfamily pyrophosphatase or phosphodiesterase